MPTGGGQYLKLSMIVFSNHSMGLVGAWRLPEIDSDKSTTTLPAEDCLKMRMHQVPQAVLCSLFGSYIELVPPPLGFALLLPRQKWHKKSIYKYLRAKKAPFDFIRRQDSAQGCQIIERKEKPAFRRVSL